MHNQKQLGMDLGARAALAMKRNLLVSLGDPAFFPLIQALQ
jgi:hypothetical protein